MTLANVTRTAYQNGTIANATAVNTNEDAIVTALNATITEVNTYSGSIATINSNIAPFLAQTITAPVTISSSTSASVMGYTNIEMLDGGSFVVATGCTFTIDVPFRAPLKQVFSGTGAVVFGSGAVSEVIPQWWGAKGDGTTDDSDAIQKAINCCKAMPYKLADGITVGGSYLTKTGKLVFPPANYLISKPLWFGNDTATSNNYTNIVDSVSGYGATIIGKFTGKCVIDLSGAMWTKWEGLTIMGAPLTAGTPSTAPKVGILLARVGSNPAASGGTNSAGVHRFTDVTVHGDFTVACVYNYASEINDWNNCVFYNNSGRTVYINTCDNYNYHLTSDYALVDNQYQSCYGDLFSTCSFKSATNNATASGAVIWLESVNFGPSIYNSYIDSSGAVSMANVMFRIGGSLTPGATNTYCQNARISGCTFEYRSTNDIVFVNANAVLTDFVLENNSMECNTGGGLTHVRVSTGAKLKSPRIQPTAGDTLGNVTSVIVEGTGEVYQRELTFCEMRTSVSGTDWAYTESTFTKDGAYHSIALSAFGVPSTAKFVRVKMAGKSSAAAEGNSYILRGSSATPASDYAVLTPQVSNITSYYEAVVPVVGGSIEYNVPSNFTIARVKFEGFWY